MTGNIGIKPAKRRRDPAQVLHVNLLAYQNADAIVMFFDHAKVHRESECAVNG